MSTIIKQEVLDQVGVVPVNLNSEKDLLLGEALAEQSLEPVGSVHGWVLLHLLRHLPCHLQLPLLNPPHLLLYLLLLNLLLKLLHLCLLYLLQNVLVLRHLQDVLHLLLLELLHPFVHIVLFSLRSFNVLLKGVVYRIGI